MHKSIITYLFIVFLWIVNAKVYAQFQAVGQVQSLVDDAIFYSKSYITPGADAAIYQASSNWVTTPKSRKLWDVALSLHANVFFVPKSNRKFTINDADFSFFNIESGSTATVPTALGNDNQVWLVGQINDGPIQTEVRLKSPEGIDSETVTYPYLQGALGLWFGTELVAKYSTRVKLKKGNYQVYGLGLKHNLSQYFKSIEAKNIYFSGFLGFSNEEIAFDFLASQAEIGDIGLNQIAGFIQTWQFQINASKQWKKFEVGTALIANSSEVEYEVGSASGQIGLLSPVKGYLNNRLSEINATKTNILGELSCRYQFGKVYIQPSFAFGKFINSNFSVQYEF